MTVPIGVLVVVKKLQLAFSTPDLVYDAVVFFLPFHRCSVVVRCGIWLPYFMIITFLQA